MGTHFIFYLGLVSLFYNERLSILDFGDAPTQGISPRGQKKSV